MMQIAPGRHSATMWSAGHPAPLARIGTAGWKDQVMRRELPLGVDPNHVWSPGILDLGSTWELLLYTDGLIEGRPGPDADALWVDGLLDLLATLTEDDHGDPDQLVRQLTRAVRQRSPGHDDDVAVVMLTYSGNSQASGG
jgi:serine phosphatase RsbU (regulator of sigma subunit)